MDLKAQVKERDDVIRYLKEQISKVTGNDVQFPANMIRYQDTEASEVKPKALEEVKTFFMAVQDLDLPPPIQRAAKPKNSRSRLTSARSDSLDKSGPIRIDPTNPKHMVESILLDDFVHRKFTKETFRELMGGLRALPRLKVLSLRRNLIGDSYLQELEELMALKKLRRLDLSHNEIGKLAASKLAELLRANDNKHLEWLDISWNPF